MACQRYVETEFWVDFHLGKFFLKPFPLGERISPWESFYVCGQFEVGTSNFYQRSTSD